MVNSKDFGKRIQKIMDFYNVSASSFADYMGVGRSSISHILSGRNRPSLDFVMKIVDAYTDVELDWLLYGKGVFPKSENKPLTQETVQSTPTTPASEPLPPTQQTEQDLFSTTITETEVSKTQGPLQENTKRSITGENKIDRVLIFYTDGTFDEYSPKRS
ncbi:helix-turn-helix transcriptional regulator [Aquimarina sp. MMG016]|uniref:helix-turn-helix domain-containing protein n=1 Tax=Aquimarina sp. MMG016 TaxID=2822690 RepID=UPI001B3A2BA8|nr:helix-turn-helix transcriptional regulator [Aquimarina sp. MMG016]MBQ4819137.1 helix-turn-helix domain-containing protein [Aquimarina sp. MMG016]